MKYIVKFEYRATWNTLNDINDESQWIVTDSEIESLAEQWGADIETLLRQVDVVEGEHRDKYGEEFKIN